MTLYGAAVALSAFLLFQVQPIVAKMILPWFGGSAAVWTTALMFFQLGLLTGYVYSHATTQYLKPKTQASLHIVLLAGSLLFLPVIPSMAWKVGGAADPTSRIVLLLSATVGLPYFMLSTTGPLLQAWYAALRPGATPYRLFAVSNAGSMLALLSFPIAVEPFLAARAQAMVWSGAYAGFVVLCIPIALGAAKGIQAESTQHAATMDETAAQRPSARLQFLWIALPACASALLLAVTNHLTQNVAPIPFLWVLTLALYLASFILCFESDRFYKRAVFIPLLGVALGSMAYAIYADYGNLQIEPAVLVFGAGLFLCCMVCHGELARLKPHPRYLTQFYLSLALGGALGGIFVALVAPHVFQTYLELPISIVLCGALAAYVLWNQIGQLTFRMAAAGFLTVLTTYLAANQILDQSRYIASVRNFYGVLRVTERLDTGETSPMRKLVNGTIIHGQQLSDPRLKRQATSYYGPESGVGRAVLLLDRMHSQVRFGVIGLGAGVLAAYCRPGDLFRFYEINPLDVTIAKRYFTFLKDCAGKCEISPGDARLVLERQAPQEFDLLVVDAFSSDSIPIHLLTREAFAQYFRHLRPGGILAVHVTNRFLDLVPVVARASEELGQPAYEISDEGLGADYWAASDWVLVGPDTHIFVLLGFHGGPIVRRRPPKSLRTWTDDFSNLYQILK
jgi:SAM-dependent methyltransferase